MMHKKFAFILKSRKHGTETIEYDTLQEAIAAVVSVTEHTPADGLTRIATIQENMVTYWHPIYIRKWKAEKAPRNWARMAVRQAIKAVLNYNWNDERDDYADHPGERGHIFCQLVTLDNWLSGTCYTPDRFLKESEKKG